MADALSASAANSVAARRVLRMRSRYEVANNSYARGIVLTLANDTIGTGPRLQMLTQDQVLNRQVQSLFDQWAWAVRLPEKLRTMRIAKVQDGESFGVLINNPRLSTPVTLDLRLVEADQIMTPNGFPAPGWVDGIIYDPKTLNPIEYHLLKHHPGDLYVQQLLQYDKLSPDVVIHYFRTDRPGEVRGIPELTPALPLFAQLRRYTLAVLSAAECAADQALVIYTDAPAAGQSDELEALDSIELERGLATTMPAGWKMGQVHSEQPSTGYKEFKSEVLNEIGRCLNMPLNVIMANSSGYNYSSGRLDHKVYWKSIEVEQSHIERVVLDHLFHSWLDEAALIEGLLPQSLRTRSIVVPHAWHWDFSEHIDPVKDATAQQIRLETGVTNLAVECATEGQDWRTQVAQGVQVKKEMIEQYQKELGMSREEAVALAFGTKPAPATVPANEGANEAE